MGAFRKNAHFLPSLAESNARTSMSEQPDMLSTMDVNAAAADAEKRAAAQRMKQLMKGQGKGRTALESEEHDGYVDILRMERTYRESMELFRNFKQEKEDREERSEASQIRWNVWTVTEQLCQLVLEEEEKRFLLAHWESERRITLARLFALEGIPCWTRYAQTKLMEAESIRRRFLYAEELMDALDMDIPHFKPIVVVVQEAVSSNKIDWMGSQRCPFHLAENCPFFPARLLERPSRTPAAAIPDNRPKQCLCGYGPKPIAAASESTAKESTAPVYTTTHCAETAASHILHPKRPSVGTAATSATRAAITDKATSSSRYPEIAPEPSAHVRKTLRAMLYSLLDKEHLKRSDCSILHPA